MPSVDAISTALVDTHLAGTDAQEQLLLLARRLAVAGCFAPCVCAPEGAGLLTRAADSGLPTCPLPAAAPAGIRGVWRLWRHFSRGVPLIVHSFDDASLRLCGRVAALRSDTHTRHLHSCIWLTDCASGFSLHRAWRGLLRRGGRVVCGSHVVRNFLQDAGIPHAALERVLPACDMDALPPRVSHGDGRVIFMVQEALEDQSNLSVLLRAMTILGQRHDLPPWEVRVVGQGSAFASLLDEARALGVASRLALLGAQPSAVMAQADVIIAPSARPQGSWPAPALAWGLGTPLLYNAVDGHKELADGQECGLMLAMNDPQLLAQTMIRCMTDAALRERLHVCSAALRPHMDGARVVEQYSHLYARLAGEAGWFVPDAGESATPAVADAAATPATDAGPSDS